MMSVHSPILAAMLLAMFVATHTAPAIAEDNAAAPTLSDESQAGLEKLATRLQLTDRQKADIRPILVQAAMDRQQILKGAGVERGTRPGLFQLMKIRAPLKESRERTRAKLADILNPDQMAEYQKIADEMRAELRKRYQG